MKAHGRGTRRIAIVLLLIQLMIVYRMIETSRTVYFLRQDKDDQKLIKAVLSARGITRFSVSRDDEAKECWYELKFSERAECSMKDYFQVRELVNRYLRENPDCYLHQGYQLTIWLVYKHAGPIMNFRNFSPYQEKKEEPKLWNQLDGVEIYIPVRDADLVQLTDYRHIELRGPWDIDDWTVLSRFSKLQYLRLRVVVWNTDEGEEVLQIPIEDQEEIKKIRPDIKVSPYPREQIPLHMRWR